MFGEDVMEKLEQWKNLEQQVDQEIRSYQESIDSIRLDGVHHDYTEYFTNRDILSIYQKSLHLREGYQSLIALLSSNPELSSNELLVQTLASMEEEGFNLCLLLLTIMKLTKMEYYSSSSEKSIYLEFNEFIWKAILMYQEREDCPVVVVNLLEQYLNRLSSLEYGLLKVQQYTKDFHRNSEIALQPLRIFGKNYLLFESSYLFIYETVLEMLESEFDQLPIDEVLRLIGGIYDTEFFKQNSNEIQKRKI